MPHQIAKRCIMKVFTGAAIVLSMILAPRIARAEEIPTELLGSAGFTEFITTGVQPFGFGVGLSIGKTLQVPLHLSGRLLRSSGARASASGPGSIYSSRSSAWSIDAGAAWAWQPAPWLFVRPGITVSTSLVSNRTQVQTVALRTTDLFFSLGPRLTVLTLPVRGFLAGVEAEARYVPARPYAPLASVSLVWGAQF
jgi:hypothetical protein